MLEPTPLVRQISLAAVLLQGFAAFLSPCILPMVPVYLTYLTGQAAMEEKPPLGRLLARALWFVLGFTLVYVAMGATASALGGFLARHQDVLLRVGGGIMVVFGLGQLGLFHLPALSLRTRKVEGPLSACLLGMTLSVAWSGCTAPTLMFVLALAGNAATVLQGVGLLAVYSLALGVPFLILALCFGALWGKLRRGMRFLPWVQRVSAVIMIIFGLAMLLGWFGGWMAGLASL